MSYICCFSFMVIDRFGNDFRRLIFASNIYKCGGTLADREKIRRTGRFNFAPASRKADVMSLAEAVISVA